jgi:phosphoribosylamine---glycine ligase
VVRTRLPPPLPSLCPSPPPGDLPGAPAPQWRPGAAVTVVLAANGYPEHPVKGDKIKIMTTERVANSYLLHAGTTTGPDGTLLAAGGRVLNAVGSGPDIAAARQAAYALAATVDLRGGWYRHDIAANR